MPRHSLLCMTPQRTPTPVDAVAETHLDESAALNPLEATYGC